MHEKFIVHDLFLKWVSENMSYQKQSKLLFFLCSFKILSRQGG